MEEEAQKQLEDKKASAEKEKKLNATMLTHEGNIAPVLTESSDASPDDLNTSRVSSISSESCASKKRRNNPVDECMDTFLKEACSLRTIQEKELQLKQQQMELEKARLEEERKRRELDRERFVEESKRHEQMLQLLMKAITNNKQ